MQIRVLLVRVMHRSREKRQIPARVIIITSLMKILTLVLDVIHYVLYAPPVTINRVQNVSPMRFSKTTLTLA